MGLFTKKPPCPICGGKISWLLPMKIEGVYICDDCTAKIDLPEDVKDGLTMASFRDYLAFHQENCRLREQFVTSAKIDFGLWDTKMIFDYEHKLFCVSKAPDKTVFAGPQLTSFVIYEDHMPLYEGSGAGIVCHPSSVPDRAVALAPRIAQYLLSRQMAETLNRMDDDDEDRRRVPYCDVPEPMRTFTVELRLAHPYWSVIRADMEGPLFSNTHPDIESYLHDYGHCIEMLEDLVMALKTVAFPDAVIAPCGADAPSAGADAVVEIQRYKALLDDGLITEAEFGAKKKQLMGI